MVAKLSMFVVHTFLSGASASWSWIEENTRFRFLFLASYGLRFYDVRNLQSSLVCVSLFGVSWLVGDSVEQSALSFIRRGTLRDACILLWGTVDI